MAPFICVAFQSGLLSSCPHAVKGYDMVPKLIAFIFLLFKAEEGNIMCAVFVLMLGGVGHKMMTKFCIQMMCLKT
jgi:hypothetical protein